MQHLPVRWLRQPPVRRRTAVQRVPDQRAPQRLHVHADLVRAAGLDAATHPGDAFPQAPHDRVMRDRLPPVGAHHGHAFAVHRMTADQPAYSTRLARRRAVRQRLVLLGDAPGLKQPHQPGHRRIVLCDNQQPGGLFVQPVHDARTLHAADPAEVAAMVKQRIDQGAVRMPRRRMHHQSGRLVEHQQVTVLVKDVERDRLRLRHRRQRRGHLDLERLPGRHRRIGFDRPACTRHPALLDQRLNARAREAGRLRGQPGIEPAGRAVRHREGQDGTAVGLHLAPRVISKVFLHGMPACLTAADGASTGTRRRAPDPAPHAHPAPVPQTSR
ncbi:MAG: hypothetical protein BWX70_02328 [Verrucomicrobia bacterium ADurb.Bin070]|nr:MAG: hypothetical protein BWX70_02328 [Verrucomicrobia bacterium ADurb.Bin070]